MDEEIWKTIEGFEDYKISTNGKVMSLKNNKQIILKPFFRGKPTLPYMCVDLRKDNKRNIRNIHILVAQAFIENPEPEKYNLVDHIDSKQRFNNSVSNLRWADYEMQNQNREFVINAKNIYFVEGRNKPYQFKIMRNNLKHVEYFATEQEAIDYRKEFLAKYAEQQSV